MNWRERRRTEFDFRVAAAISFLVASGGLIVVSLMVPDYVRPAWFPVYVALGATSFLLAALVAWIGTITSPGAAGIISYADVAIVLAGFAQLNHSTARLDAALLVLPTLFVAVFLSWHWLLGQVVATTACAALILGLSGDRPVVIAVQTLIVVTIAACPATIVIGLRNELAAALASSRQQAVSDPLTGLLNRRGLDQHATAVISRARRAQVALGVLVADLDHFKSVNDRYGHAVGDQVLRKVAGTALACVRADDLVVRLGGEEIAVIAVLEPDRLAELAERLRAEVEEIGATWGVTVSIGVASRAVDENASGELLWAMIDSADDLMYGAKRAGRNRVNV